LHALERMSDTSLVHRSAQTAAQPAPSPPAGEASADVPSLRRSAALCACGQAAKYRCPRCAAASCSAACVAAHKAAPPGCSGKREAAAFVPLAAFDDAHLFRDLAFLEETQRAAERAKRSRADVPGAASFGGGSAAAPNSKGSRLQAARVPNYRSSALSTEMVLARRLRAREAPRCFYSRRACLAAARTRAAWTRRARRAVRAARVSQPR